MSSNTRDINFGHSGKIILEFENNDKDTKVTIVSTNDFDGHHLWIAFDDLEKFTNDFKELVDKYFI